MLAALQLVSGVRHRRLSYALSAQTILVSILKFLLVGDIMRWAWFTREQSVRWWGLPISFHATNGKRTSSREMVLGSHINNNTILNG